MIKIGISGAAGRMGKELIQAMQTMPDLQLSNALVEASSDLVGKDIGTHLGISGILGNFTAALTSDIKVVIDFSTPKASMQNLAFCRTHKIAMVIGTTGFSDAEKAEISAAANEIAIVFAPNMSIGVNVSLKLVDLATKLLGDAYDVEILDIHHRHKLDSPSGTALALGEAVANARGDKLAEVAVYERHSKYEARKAKQIGFVCMRLGDYVGEHKVIFSTFGETFEIVHKASSRATFAFGALRAAQWLQDKPIGLYDMQAVLGLKN